MRPDSVRVSGHSSDSYESIESCPVQHSSKDLNDGCPVDHGKSDKYNAKANDMEFNHLPQEGQTVPLKAHRVTSTIPKGEFTPNHQPKAGDKWVYPSEQQYYNAMKRKGHNPDAADVPYILSIHNSVNEQGWTKIREWEALRGNPNPSLVRFMGRPDDKTPKALFREWVLGYKPPFDRHDWIVERNGKEVRYVIDFYRGGESGSRIGIHLDVRPALDSFTAVVDTVGFTVRRWLFPHTLPKSSLVSHPIIIATIAVAVVPIVVYSSMNKGTSESKNGIKPVQKSIMSHFFGQKPAKAAIVETVEQKAPEAVVIAGLTTVEIVEQKAPEVVVIADPVSKEDNSVEIIEPSSDLKPETTKIEIHDLESSKEEMKDLVAESPATALPSANVVTPSPPASVEVTAGRRSSRIATNAEAYAKTYYEALANAPESPPKRSKRSAEKDSDDEYEDRKRKPAKSGSSSFFLSNKDKLALKEKERLEKIQRETEELQAQLLREAQERDQRMHEQLARTREENNRMFCMTTSEDGVAKQKQTVRNADGLLEEVEVTITSNPFFNARVAAAAASGSGGNVMNLEEDNGDTSLESGVLFPTMPSCGSTTALQLIKIQRTDIVSLAKRGLNSSPLSDQFEQFLTTNSLAVNPSTTSLDLAYLSFAFACSQDSRQPVNPQYVTGSTPINLRMLWLLYYSQHCGKYLQAAPAANAGASGVPVPPASNASIFSNFLTPKIARPLSTTSLNSTATGITSISKVSGETVLVGNTEARLALQQWLEEWAGKRRTPKKQKTKGKTASKGGKRGRRDDDYSSEEDAWDSENEEQGLSNVLMLLGSSGTNKTATVYHYAKQLGYNVMEVNASMIRSRALIQKMFSEGVQSQSMASSTLMDLSNQNDVDGEDDVRVNGKKPAAGKSFLSNSGVKSSSSKPSGVDVNKKSLNLILFDEIDVVFEEEDIHFHSAIVSLSKISKCPIVLTSETLCPTFIRTCKPKLVRMYRPNPVDVASHLLAKLQSGNTVKPDKGSEIQLMCKSILPLLCDGDSRACQNTLNTISIAKSVTTATPTWKSASSAVVVDLCEASPAPRTVIDLEVVDLTANSPKSADKPASSSEITPAKEVPSVLPAVTEEKSEVSPPLFGSFLAEKLNLDFAVFDRLGSVLIGEEAVTVAPSAPFKVESVNTVARRRSQEADSLCAALVVPLVSAVEPRTMLSCDNNVIRVFGKHFLQTISPSETNRDLMTVEVLLNETPLKECVVVSDTVIAAVVPAALFTAGVYSVVVRLSSKCHATHGIRSDICGSAGGWILINDRVFKEVRVSAVNLSSVKAKKATKPIAKTMDLFVFGSTPVDATTAAPTDAVSPRASGGKRLQRSADKVSPSKRARQSDVDGDNASVNTEATEDDELRDAAEESREKTPAGKQPVRRRLQVCDDEDEDDEDEGGIGEAVNEDVRSVHSAGLTESTVDEKTAVSEGVVKDFCTTLHAMMVVLLRDLMSPSLKDFNAHFLNAPISDKEVTSAASAMDLATIDNLLRDKLYVKNTTFQNVVESEFPDLEAYVQDVRSVWSNSLTDCDANSVHLLHACMLSDLFEKSLKQLVEFLSHDPTQSFNVLNTESLEAPLAVVSNGSLSMHLYNVPVGHIAEYKVLSDHQMFSSWLEDSRFKDLTTVLSSSSKSETVVEVDMMEVAAPPALEVSLEEYTPSLEKLTTMLNESHDKRIKFNSSGLTRTDFGAEYTNEDSPLVFVPYSAGRINAKKVVDEAEAACVDSLMDLSESLDLLSSMDILNTRAVNYCNYADAYIPPAASAAPSSSSAAASASITEVNNDFDSMYERFAMVGGEEMYDHIPDELMVNSCNSSNSSEASECNFATFQRSGVALSDASAIVQNGVLNLNKSRIVAQLSNCSRSEKYTSSYRYLLTSYKYAPTIAAGSESAAAAAAAAAADSKSNSVKSMGRLNSSKRSSDYCSSSEEEEMGDDEEDSDDQGVFIESECDQSKTPSAATNAADGTSTGKIACTLETLEKTLDSPYLSFMSKRLAVIRGVLTLLCHEDYGVFDNCNHQNTLCPAMAMDLFPMLVLMCRCEALFDSAESNSYSVGRSSFTGSGRRSARGRGGGGVVAPEKFAVMKVLTQLSESQLETLMSLMKWTYK